MRYFLFLITALLLSTFSFSQELLSEETLKQQKVYKNISHALANKDSVFRLELHRERLKEFPKEILALYNLQELTLTRNKLRKIPPQISKLQLLQVLNISKNKIKSLPDEIGDLKHLRELRMNRNLIEALPFTIGGLQELRILEMWDNELSFVPDEISNLSKLQVLELRGILFSEDEQARIKSMLPYDTKVYFSPACNCN